MTRDNLRCQYDNVMSMYTGYLEMILDTEIDKIGDQVYNIGDYYCSDRDIRFAVDSGMQSEMIWSVGK